MPSVPTVPTVSLLWVDPVANRAAAAQAPVPRLVAGTLQDTGDPHLLAPACAIQRHAQSLSQDVNRSHHFLGRSKLEDALFPWIGIREARSKRRPECLLLVGQPMALPRMPRRY